MSQKWWVLAAVACGTFMATLDSSIVNIALPTLTKELGANIHQVKWIVIIYLLAITCVLLPFGRLSDLYGRKRVMLIGFSLFILSSALCGLANHLHLLIGFRLIQGAGAAMLMANGPAIITAQFPSGERGKALGLLAMVVSFGLISGPSLGGLLISSFNWRSIFFINIPVGIFGLVLASRYLPKQRPSRTRGTFDWAGAVLQFFFLLAFTIVMEPPSVAFSGGAPFPVSRWVMLAICVLFGLLLVRFEQQTPSPLIDLSLFKIKSFWMANLGGFFSFVSLSSVTVLTPFFMEESLGLSTDRVGLLMTAIPLTILIVAPLSGRASDRVGTSGISALGALIGALTLFWMSGATGFGFSDEISTFAIALTLSLIGLASGLFQSPNNSAIMEEIPSSKLGIASALLATVRNLGLVTGTGLSTNLFSWGFRETKSYTKAIHLAFMVCGFVYLAAMMISLARSDRRRRLAQ